MTAIAQRVAQAPKPTVIVGLSIPVYEHFQPQFGYSLAKLMLWSGVTMVADGLIDILPNMVEATVVHKARNELTKQALKTHCTHMLWLDSDLKFPENALFRLLNWDKPVVGCNYPHRRFPIRHTAFKIVGKGHDREADVMCRTTDDKSGLEEVEGIGFGMLLMRTNVLDQIERPWFEMPEGVGEDICFCRKLTAAGIPIYCDHDLSKELYHFGPIGYNYQHAEEYLAREWSTHARENEVAAPSEVPAVEGVAADTPAEGEAGERVA
jgi:hypothetical protein